MCREAARIILDSRSFQAARRVRSRIPSHSAGEGSCRVSRFASQSAERSASRISARPRRVSFCLRAATRARPARGSRA